MPAPRLVPAPAVRPRRRSAASRWWRFSPARPSRRRGALDGLERETLKARFDLRGAERPDDVVVVAIDAKTFAALRSSGRSLARCTAVRCAACTRRGRARSSTTSSSPSRRSRVRTWRSSTRSAPRAVRSLPPARATAGGTTNVLGGDANLRRVNARAGASDLHNDGAGAVTHLPHDGRRARVDGCRDGRAGRPPSRPVRVRRRRRLDRLQGPRRARSARSRSPTWCAAASHPDTFRGRIVVVGASAPTLRDVHATPVGGGEPMAGAEVQANAIWTALHGMPLRGAPPAVGFVLIALMAFLAPLLCLRLPALVTGVAGPLAGAVFLVGGPGRFESGTIVNVVPPLVALVVGHGRHDRLEPARREPCAPRRLPGQRATRGARPRAHPGAAADPGGGPPAAGRGGGVARRRDRAPHRADRPVLRAPRARGRHGARRTPSCCATRARCTTSARSASQTTSSPSPARSTRRSGGS